MKIKEDVNAKILASLTPGFSGADIACLVNTAVLQSVDMKIEEISKKIFEETIERILLGIKKRNPYKTEKQLFQSAIHQAGHALVCYNNRICKETLLKASVEYYKESKGVVITLKEEKQYTKEDFLSIIDMSLGGVLAEEVVFGKSKLTAGCGKDLNQAGKLVEDIVKKLGMSTEWGLSVIAESSKEHRLSKTSLDEADLACNKILKESEIRVRKILSDNKDKLFNLAKKLAKEKTLLKEEIQEILKGIK